MYHIAKAECVFTTQVPGDIAFDYKKKGRRFFYMSHGLPFKRAFKALNGNDKFAKRASGLKKLLRPILLYLTKDNGFDDCEFEISTSEYLVQYVQMFYGENIPVKIVGYPRIDVLFDKERMKTEKWLTGTENKFVITYMPTHRGMGSGEVSPFPFENMPDVHKWMQERNIVFIMKQHPNMMAKTNPATTDAYVDITKCGYDTQVCLYHTDILITDFSSVWIDYFVLRRPVIFYYYDDFVHQDWGQLYDITSDPPGSFCYSPEELFDAIKKIFANYDTMRPSDRIVRKFHKFTDGNSCQRYFEAITSNIENHT